MEQGRQNSDTTFGFWGLRVAQSRQNTSGRYFCEKLVACVATATDAEGVAWYLRVDNNTINPSLKEQLPYRIVAITQDISVTNAMAVTDEEPMSILDYVIIGAKVRCEIRAFVSMDCPSWQNLETETLMSYSFCF